MIKLVGYNALSYALSAGVFLLFTVVFSRQFGTEAYAEFSILLNSLSAILLISNYQGYLVSYSVAESRDAIRRYARYAVPYTLLAALAAATIFWFVTELTPVLWPFMALAFGLLFGITLPSTVLLASAENWRLVAYRAVYQVLIVVLFYGLYLATGRLEMAFVAAGVGAASVFLLLVLRRAFADLGSGPSDHPDAPGSIILVAAGANGAVMLTQLIDKFAVNHLGVGPGQACVGVYFIYYDVVFRVGTIYLMFVYPLTYTFLRHLREGIPLGRTFATMIGGIAAITSATVAAGYLVVPPVYGISLDCAPLLPLLMSLFMAFTGVGYLVVAFCNAAGFSRILAKQNLAVLLAMAAGIAAGEFLAPDGLSVTWLAAALAVGKAGTAVTLTIILLRLFRTRGRLAATAAGSVASEA
ncbi:MAG TPA: hypothetical protein VFO41_18305 [Alphaproteobacteria bacterium]|nr:hypothetical protein [Alphaproteobacteria bacterium]